MNAAARGDALGATFLVTHHWYCPNCGSQRSTRGKPRHVLHICPRLRYLAAPMLPAGVKAKVEIKEREDYIGQDLVQLDPEQNRPVGGIITTRDNGQDAIVLAPTATAKGA